MLRNLQIYRAIENLLVVFTLLLANRRAFVFQDFYLKIPFVSGHLWVELLIWVGLLCWVLWAIWRKDLWSDIIKAWKTNWFLIPFLVTVVASLSWTIHMEASLYRVLVLVLTTFIAVFMGVEIGRDRFISLLTWCGLILILGSYLIVYLMPIIGTMIGHPYYSAWRGVFWHRNQLSITLAFFAIVLLVKIIKQFRPDGLKAIFFGLFYISSIILVVMSRSFTGILLLFGAHFFLLVAYLWQRWQKALRPIHYRILGAGILGILAIGFIRIEQIAGLVNKAGSWSGRIVLWKYLVNVLILQRPVLGYGYGAIWNFHDFRVELGQIIGWNMPILIGDNGYIDILLHLGSVGLILFLGVIFMASTRFLKQVREEQFLESTLPVILVILLLIANISFSLFMEVESFFWIVLVAMLFGLPIKLGDSNVG